MHVRMAESEDFRQPGAKLLKPEMEWLADGLVHLNLFYPVEAPLAEAAALETGRRMGLLDCEVISREIMHPREGTRIEMKGHVPFALNVDELVVPKPPETMSGDEARGQGSILRRWQTPWAAMSTPSACAKSSTSSTARREIRHRVPAAPACRPACGRAIEPAPTAFWRHHHQPYHYKTSPSSTAWRGDGRRFRLSSGQRHAVTRARAGRADGGLARRQGCA